MDREIARLRKRLEKIAEALRSADIAEEETFARTLSPDELVHLGKCVRQSYRAEFRNWSGQPKQRAKSMIGGWPWVTAEHPWPLDGSKRKIPLGPLLQLDLAEVGKLGRIDLGTGLLQIFVNPDAWELGGYTGTDAVHIRRIPEPNLSEAHLLLPFPWHDRKPESYFPLNWLQQKQTPIPSNLEAVEMVDPDQAKRLRQEMEFWMAVGGYLWDKSIYGGPCIINRWWPTEVSLLNEFSELEDADIAAMIRGTGFDFWWDYLDLSSATVSLGDLDRSYYLAPSSATTATRARPLRLFGPPYSWALLDGGNREIEEDASEGYLPLISGLGPVSPFDAIDKFEILYRGQGQDAEFCAGGERSFD